MKEILEERLASLTAEYRTGQEMLADLEARQANLRLTLARISGAIQVLDEILKQDASAPQEQKNSVSAAAA